MTEATPVAMEVWKEDWHRLALLACEHEDVCLNEATSRLYSSIATALADMQRRVEELEGALRKLDEELEEGGFASIGTKRRIIAQALSDKTQEKNGDSHPTPDAV